ncbi:hypothetical protein LguiA_033859 [Lonicera macranthoides]
MHSILVLIYSHQQQQHLLRFIQLVPNVSSICRKKRPSNRLRRERVVVSKMAAYEGKTVTSDVSSGKMVFKPILEEGVFRFDCSADDSEAAFPSLSFVNPKDRDTPIMSVHKVPSYTPTFESIMGQQIVNIEFPLGTSFYGTGEVSGQLERTGKRVFTWNSATWGFGPRTKSLHQSHPWVLAVLPNGEALGVLADTTRRCEIDLRKDSTVKLIAVSSYPIITFGRFASPADVLTSLSHAVGTVFMPPKWSLGYQQCRWSYDSDARVREIAKTFHEKGIPCDVIWMDINYMDRSVSQIQNLWSKIFIKLVSMQSGCLNQGSNVKRAISCEVWPGPCVFPDYTQSKARLWWAGLVKEFISNGVDGIWNDMNEPTLFEAVTRTMPESNIHRGDPELGGSQNHFHYHNAAKGYAATWTGDNLSTWEHLHMSMGSSTGESQRSNGLSGQPLSGPDIGGFGRNATPKLFGRWMGVGAMFPFCRGHSEMDSADHEPWSFGEEALQQVTFQQGDSIDLWNLSYGKICGIKRTRRFSGKIFSLVYPKMLRGTDPKDPSLRTNENSFMLGPLLIYASTTCDQGVDQLQHTLPKGIWKSFDFDDSHPDLPALYLQGGSIIPFSLPYQHNVEANPTDDLSLLVALDENGTPSGITEDFYWQKKNAKIGGLGKAKGVLFEDDGDGYEYARGGYLLTTYVAELQSSVVTLRISKTEGSWLRPNRLLHVQLLLGNGAKVCTLPILMVGGTDGEDLKITVPSEDEVSKLVSTSKEKYKIRMGIVASSKLSGKTVKSIPDVEKVSGHKGIELSLDWALKVVPWIGDQIISMEHIPSGIQLLHSWVDINGYEEYSVSEYRSTGCTEEYTVIDQDLEQEGEVESLKLEGDIGNALVLQRHISFQKDNQKVFQICSSIVAIEVGAGSGGFSRLVCLRVHPMFTLLHPTESYVSFTSINGTKHEVCPEFGEHLYEGDLRPNGEWMLVDKCVGLGLLNRFKVDQVYKCMIHWGTGTVNLELWSEEKSVSEQSPLKISRQYEVRTIS